AHDPVAAAKAAPLLPPGVRLAESAEAALRGAEAALLLTEWPDYAALPPQLLREAMARPLLIDGRNAYPPHRRGELEYVGIGLGAAAPELQHS
ncbi:UDP-glucose 6-dehydrogenase, partial [Paenibacillus sp. IB182496]